MKGDEQPVPIAVGITIGLLASFVQSLGLTIQRKSHLQNQSLPECDQRVEHHRPLWLLGFAIFIISNILGSLFQIASLPVVILAPLGAVSLLWNAFFARLLLGDVFSPWMLIGTLLIAGGAVLIAIFGIVPEPAHSLEDLLLLLRRPPFIVYFSLLGMTVLIGLVVTHITEYSLARKLALDRVSPPVSPRPLPAADLTLPVPPPANLATTSERTPLLDQKPRRSRSSTPAHIHTASPAALRTRLFIAIAYASASGILSGMCLIFAKSGVELLLISIGGDNQFWRWESWALLVGLAVFALMQLWYLHKGLVFADPTIVCPLAFCFYNLSSIVSSLVYYDQFALLSILHKWLVGLGIVVLLGGVWLVSFPSGGGGVDIGTWQEGDDCMEASIEAQDTADDRPTLSHFLTSPTQLESASLPPLHHRFPSSPLQSPTSAADGENNLSESLELSPEARRRRSTRAHKPRFSLLLPSSPSADSHNSQMSTLNIAAAAGLSIGLSPVSPGFAIVPQRRRISSMTGAARNSVMRRTVSEGDVNARTGSSAEDPIAPISTRQVKSDRTRGLRRPLQWLRGLFGVKD